MSMLFILSTVVIVLGASLILQGVVLRTAYRSKAAKQHAKHLQFQQTTSGQFEQSKRQIGQLQNDLVAARRQLKQFARSAAAPTQSGPTARQALERELDDTSASRRCLPVDGFADTQPSTQVTQYGSLLLQ